MEEGLKFPVKYDLKVIYHAQAEDSVLIERLTAILNAKKIPFHGQCSVKPSKEGKYRSINIPVSIADREMFELLYASLKEDPWVKFAL